MEQKKDLVKTEGNQLSLTEDDVRKYFCPNATLKEVGLFLKIAKSCGLNPFKRELYLIKYGDTPATIVTGYEVYLKRAERSAKYAGFKVWVEGDVPDMKALIEVYRKDWIKPLCHEVEYSEYVGKKKDGTPTKFWKDKPKTMLKKVVISQAFRFAFPDELAGMPYTADEINVIDVETIEKETSNPKANVAMPKEKTETKPKEPTQEEIEFPGSPEPEQPKENEYQSMLKRFVKAKETIGDNAYYEILGNFGLKHANAIRSISQGNQIIEHMRKNIANSNG